MTEVPLIQKTVHWFALHINGLVSIYRGLLYERVNKYKHHNIERLFCLLYMCPCLDQGLFMSYVCDLFFIFIFIFIMINQIISWIWTHFFFNCYLAVPRPTLGYSQGDSLTNLMLITAFVHVRPEGHREPRSEVGSLSPAERPAGFAPGTFQFWLQHLKPLGHSPLLLLLPSFLENVLLFLDDNLVEECEQFSNSKSSTSRCCLAFAWIFTNFSLVLLIKVLLMKKRV